MFCLCQLLIKIKRLVEWCVCVCDANNMRLGGPASVVEQRERERDKDGGLGREVTKGNF